MRRSLTFCVFFFTTFFCTHILSYAQDINLKVVQRDKNDVGGAVLGITQDMQGFLWLATQIGLYKYDGYQYISYHPTPSNPNSPASDLIECIASDRTGYVWLAPARTGLDRLDPATGIFTHFRHTKNDPGSLASDTVLAILQDRDGIVWIGTQHGLDRFDNNSNKFLHYANDPDNPSSLSCNTVRALYEDKQGTIWVGTGSAFYGENPGYEGNGGLNKLNKETGKFIRYMHDEKDPHSLIDNRVRAIFEDSRGNFWVGTAGDGLHTMDRSKGIFERHPYDSTHPDKLSRPRPKNVYSYGVDHITFITEDADGRIWIGTFGGGINVYDPSNQKVVHYGTDPKSTKQIAANEFWTAYKTKDNVLWISTWGTNLLYKVSPYQVVLPHTHVGKIVFSFAEDDEHSLWIGTDRGLIRKFNTGKEEQFLCDKDSSSLTNRIYYIERDDSKFWLLAGNNSLYLFDPSTKHMERYRHQPGNTNSLRSDTVYTVTKGYANKLWIGGPGGLDMLDTKSGVFTHVQNKLGEGTTISNTSIYNIAVDKKQNVWAITNEGLNRLDEQTGRFKKYLDRTPVNFVLADRQGNLWCSTFQGVFKYDQESDNFLNFTDESGLTNTPSFWMDEDSEQNIWIAAVAGIIRLDKDRKNAVLFGKNQAVNVGALTGNPFIRQNGEILVGDSTGFFEIKPGFFQKQSSPPFVNITKFLLNNTSVQPSTNGVLSEPLMQAKEINLRYNQNTFSFEFLNIDFISQQEDTRVLYNLQNYDNAWRKAGDEKKAYYFNVPPGKYIFKVKAISAAGLAAEKDIAVIISSPWWETWWFRVLSVIAMVIVIYSIIRERSRKLKAENVRLEQKVTERTQQLQQSINDLKSTQAQLIQSEKMASLGELTAGVAHEIQNPLNFVNNFSEVNKELIDEMQKEMDKGNFEEVRTISNTIKNNEEKIISHGKRADAIVKSMLQHSRSSTGKKEPTDINALADEYLRLTYYGLRAKDKSFNAKFETEFDTSIGKINIISQDFGRALLNLFNNSFYEVNEKAKQQINGYEPTIAISTKKVKGLIELTVKDNGNGIPQKILDKIFQPFFTTKPTGQGTGLGLSLAYDIIKAHGGDIKVETKEGEGSEFRIYLPT